MKIKAGYRTSEFWFTLVSFIFSGLYLTGLIKENENKEQLITIVSHAVESVILISGQVLILAKYIKGRTEVKKIAENKKINEEVENEVKDESERSNSRKSRRSPQRTKGVSAKTKKRSPK